MNNSLIDIKDLNWAQIEALMATAEAIRNTPDHQRKKLLAGRVVMNVFFENSTRTAVSFALAARQLGALHEQINLQHASISKGESLRDTLLTLEAMGCDAFVVRHAENDMHRQIQSWLKPATALINAGAGHSQHPTQALLDLYTLQRKGVQLDSARVCILGDSRHSRVAHSLLDAFALIGNRNAWIYGPDEWLSDHPGAQRADDLADAVGQADVIVCLRIQKERMQDVSDQLLQQYHQQFGLHDGLKIRPQAWVMHPGPMNRGLEISDRWADGPQSLVLEQVANGVAMRRAVLYTLLTGDTHPAKH